MADVCQPELIREATTLRHAYHACEGFGTSTTNGQAESKRWPKQQTHSLPLCCAVATRGQKCQDKEKEEEGAEERRKGRSHGKALRREGGVTKSWCHTVDG
jgi:hypothetical protein